MAKRALIITYYWPPSGGSGVQRWLKFTKYLPSFGWESVVYTPLNPDINSTDNTLIKDISPSTKVIKREILEPYSIYKRLSKKSSKEGIQANIISSNNSSLFHKLSLFIRANFFIPDPRCWWIRSSAKFLTKYIKENHIDVIISTGPPHSMHLIANKVSQRCNIKWVADFRDPWTNIFYFKHLPLTRFALKRHKKLEAMVLNNANAVIAVSNKMIEEFSKTREDGIHLITNGFDPDDFNSNIAIEREKGEKFLLVHTGIFVDNGNPDLLWSVLKELSSTIPNFKELLEIRLIGQVDNSIIEDIKANGLTSNTHIMGYLSHNTVTSWQKSASLLLLPLRKEPESAAILTGKFFEYIASGNPILAFGPTNGDLAEALKNSKSGTIVEFNNREAIKESLINSFNEYLKAPKQKRSLSKESLIYSREELTKELVDILNNL